MSTPSYLLQTFSQAYLLSSFLAGMLGLRGSALLAHPHHRWIPLGCPLATFQIIVILAWKLKPLVVNSQFFELPRFRKEPLFGYWRPVVNAKYFPAIN